MDYRKGDKVRLIKPYAVGGRALNNGQDPCQDIKIGSVATVSDGYEGTRNGGRVLTVTWDEYPILSRRVIDVDCLESDEPTDDEVAEAIRSITLGGQ